MKTKEWGCGVTKRGREMSSSKPGRPSWASPKCTPPPPLFNYNNAPVSCSMPFQITQTQTLLNAHKSPVTVVNKLVVFLESRLEVGLIITR